MYVYTFVHFTFAHFTFVHLTFVHFTFVHFLICTYVHLYVCTIVSTIYSLVRSELMDVNSSTPSVVFFTECFTDLD